MHALSIPASHRLAPAAPVLLRLTVGTVMAVHGWQKLTARGPAMFGQSMVADLGLPAPVAIGWTVTAIELVGGLLLIAGLLTRVASLLLMGVLAGALLFVKLDTGLIAPMGAMLPGAELDLALIAGSLGVLLLGPGRPSLDHVLGIESDVPVLAPSRREPAAS